VYVGRDLRVGTESGGEDEADLALLKNITGSVTLARLRTSVGNE
jgi:hypothetical protein